MSQKGRLIEGGLSVICQNLKQFGVDGAINFALKSRNLQAYNGSAAALVMLQRQKQVKYKFY